MTVQPESVAVVSPHLDDAVLSCGRVLAAHPGSHVVTVFTGGPAHVWRLPAWDRSSGIFSPGANVMQVRRSEDDAALGVLDARAERLGLWDSQYRGRASVLSRLTRRLPAPGPDDDQLADTIAGRVETLARSLGSHRWLIPLGLVHRDHLITAAACRRVATRMPELEWVAYEELPYAAESPELVAEALSRLADAGWQSEPATLEVAGDAAPKEAAVQCYRSQSAALGPRRDLAVHSPEAYHRLRATSDGGQR
ncbi:MAG TPA: PIG-L family deacetylase [Acidimicrobiales bacterium]|nr:PIG-L family deacetylase [Acidimicrobiales bacterium]